MALYYSQILVLLAAADQWRCPYWLEHYYSCFSLSAVDICCYMAVFCKYISKVGEPVYMLNFLLINTQWERYMVAVNLDGLSFLCADSHTHCHSFYLYICCNFLQTVSLYG